MELMGKQFRYYLTFESERIELTNAPIGWDEGTVGFFKRDEKYNGILRSLSFPLQFIREGAEIISFAFAKYGVEAGVILDVEIRDNDWGYSTIFSSNLDFSQITKDGDKVSITLLETGIGKDIKSRENIKFEFPLTGPDVVNVVLPGVSFTEKSNWITKYVDPNDLNAAKRYVLGMDLITNGYGSGYLTALNTNNRNAADSDNFDADHFVRCNRVGGVNVVVKGNLKGWVLRAGFTPSETFSIQISSNKFPFIINSYDVSTPSSGLTEFNIPIDFNWSMQEGEGWFIYVKGQNDPTANRLIVTEGEMSIEYTAISDPSNCKGIKSFDLFKRIVSRISPSTNVDSVFLKTIRKDLIFTSGAAIREITDAKIKMSFNDFFKTIYSLNDVGIGDENGILKMEEAVSFMRNTQIMDIGNVNSYQMSVAVDKLANSVNIGYNDGNTDDENGRQEYNSGQVWALPITTISDELDWKSIARADQYGIEQLRVKFNVSKTATSDRDGDNDTFMIDCNPIDEDGNYTPILGSQLNSVTGLTSPLTAYNLLLSPKHNLLNHSGYLRSILDRLDNRFIEFGSAEKNALINVTANGINVDEDREINVSELSGKYFRPIIFTVNAKMPKNAMSFISSTPFGYVSFEYNGIVAKGYILELGVDLAGNGAMEIKLLATADIEVP